MNTIMNNLIKTIVLLLFIALFPFVFLAQPTGMVIRENDSVRIEISPLKELNSAFSDYSPVITADGSQLFFTSRRPLTDKEKARNKEGREMIYVSDYDDVDNEWIEPVLLGKEINIVGRQNSVIAISNDGQRLLKYQDDQYGNGDIYESYLKGMKWSDPLSLGAEINSVFHESSASIAPDGRTIYFVSNRKGGQGGRDIWMTKRNDRGEWSAPENLGLIVNTPQDEEAVFIHPDGKTLYFSSKGHQSMGGYDIYRTTLVNGNWTVPQNLGEPLNTPGNDLFFVLTANGRRGYLASDRNGGVLNIYEVNFIPLERKDGTKTVEPKLTVLKGVITDKLTGLPLEATIEVVDNVKNEVIATFNSNSSTGKYLVSLPSGKNYGVTVQSDGYLFESFSFDLPDTAAYIEVVRDVQLNKLKAGTKVILKNIFFDFDKATLRNESVAELTRLVRIMNEYPNLKIEIGGHTDGKGSDDYNNRLSRDRAESVVNYLIDNGVDKSRLSFKGYGKAQPIASNDTEEGRQDNRRVEFKIISN